MAQQVKVLAEQTGHPEFDSRAHLDMEGGNGHSQSCPFSLSPYVSPLLSTQQHWGEREREGAS